MANKLIDVSELTKKSKDEGLLPQPHQPTYKLALVEIYVENAKGNPGGSERPPFRFHPHCQWHDRERHELPDRELCQGGTPEVFQCPEAIRWCHRAL